MRQLLSSWFAGLQPRTRFAVAAAFFLCISVWIVPLAKMLAQLAAGLAVLAIAAFGLWIMVSRLFRS